MQNWNKHILFVLFLSLLSSHLKAQPDFLNNPRQVNGGVGISVHGLPFYVSFDQFVHEDVSVGASFAANFFEDSDKGIYFKQQVYSFTFNGNYHLNTSLELSAPWDIYLGLNAGMLFWNSPSKAGKNYNSNPGIGIQLGGRYKFYDNFYANVEIGGGYLATGVRIGITYSF